jgi:hypothetical protein
VKRAPSGRVYSHLILEKSSEVVEEELRWVLVVDEVRTEVVGSGGE